jgi:hypothetical protein
MEIIIRHDEIAMYTGADPETLLTGGGGLSYGAISNIVEIIIR